MSLSTLRPFRIHPVLTTSIRPDDLFLRREFFTNNVGCLISVFLRLWASEFLLREIATAAFLLEDPRQELACFSSLSGWNIRLHNGHNLRTFLGFCFSLSARAFWIISCVGRLLLSQSLFILSCVTWNEQRPLWFVTQEKWPRHVKLKQAFNRCVCTEIISGCKFLIYFISICLHLYK